MKPSNKIVAGQSHLNFQESQEVRVIPACIFLFTFNATFFWIDFEDVQRHMTEDGKILSSTEPFKTKISLKYSNTDGQ
jgi:hypothetical protein